MKTVYKSINTSKINGSNINSILEQFKKHSITMSINDISKTSDMKYQRDFKSIPNTGNKFIDRPESSKGNSFTLNQQVQDVERKRTTIEGYDNSMNASLDQLFKPLDIQNDETEQQ